MAEHEIKLIASLDTSGINTNTGTTGTTTNRTTSSGGSSTSAVGTALIGSQLGSVGSALSLQMSKAIKSFIESLSKGITLINHQLHRLSLPLYEIVREFNFVNRDINGMSEAFGNFRDKYLSSLQTSIAVADDFTKSLKELSNSTNKASIEIKNSFNSPSNGKFGASGLLGMKIGSGGGFGEMFGRMLGAGAVMSATSNTRHLFDTIDPERKTWAGKISNVFEWITGPFEKMAREAEKANELVKESKQRLDEFNKQMEHFKEVTRSAQIEKYTMEQKKVLEYITSSELPEYMKEHGDKLKKLEKKYQDMNNTLAKGAVAPLAVDKFQKEMQKIADELKIENELFDTAAEKLKKFNDEAKRLSEETEKLNREFDNQRQSISDTRDSEKRASERREWSTMSMDKLFMQKYYLNQTWNRSKNQIGNIDDEISRLQKFYDLQTTTKGRQDIMDKINQQLQQRGRLSGIRNEAIGDLDRVNGLMKAFDDATKTLNEKAQDLRNSEALSQWKEGLKYLNGSEMTRQLKEAKDRRAELYNSILLDYQKSAGTRNPESRKKLNDRIEFQLKQMSGLDNRISTLESKTKIGFDSPDEAMTDMGRMGMYMSNAESVLTDPKLQKLDHISMTLWKIERNTQNQVVSRFL